MTLLTLDTDYQAPLSHSDSSAGLDPASLRVDAAAQSILSANESVPSSKIKDVQLVRNYSAKSGVMWECVGSTPSVKGKGEIYRFKLKAAYNSLLSADAPAAIIKTFEKIYPAVEFYPDFSGRWGTNSLRCFGVDLTTEMVIILKDMGYQCGVEENNEFYLYVPDAEAFQAGCERCRKIFPERLSSFTLLLSEGTASDRAFIDAHDIHDRLVSTDAELIHDQIHLWELLLSLLSTKGDYAKCRELMRTLIKQCADLPLQWAIARNSALPYREELETLIAMFIDQNLGSTTRDLAYHITLPNPDRAIPTASQCQLMNKSMDELLSDDLWFTYLRKRHPSKEENEMFKAKLVHTRLLIQTQFFLAQAKISLTEDDQKKLKLLANFPESLAMLADHGMLTQRNWDFLRKLFPSFGEMKNAMIEAAKKYNFTTLNTPDNRNEAVAELTKMRLYDDDTSQLLKESRVPLLCAKALIRIYSTFQDSRLLQLNKDPFAMLELERLNTDSSSAMQNFRRK